MKLLLLLLNNKSTHEKHLTRSFIPPRFLEVPRNHRIQPDYASFNLIKNGADSGWSYAKEVANGGVTAAIYRAVQSENNYMCQKCHSYTF